MYQIIHDEADFLVVNKSANVDFHSQNIQPGLVAQIELDLGIKLYPVHRLDKLTSGLLILPKSSLAANEFRQIFTEHRLQKYYLALAKGKPKKKQGRIIGDMGKSRRGSYKLLRSTENPAVTQFYSVSVAAGLRLYLLKPLTGKTHQLRVALASLSVPILGDARYGGEQSDRGYLHAWQLNFCYQGRKYQFCMLPNTGKYFSSNEVQAKALEWQQSESLPLPKS